MTKDQMIHDVKEMHARFAFLFKLANIKPEVFFHWFDRHRTHEEITRAHRFLMGHGQGSYTELSLMKPILVVNEYYKQAPQLEWENLNIHAPRHTQIVTLKKLCKSITEAWGRRPKPPRGSE